MDSTRVDPSTCDFCGGEQPKQFWIEWSKYEEDVVLKGTWCSWACYNRAFENAWDEQANGYPQELYDIGGEG